MSAPLIELSGIERVFQLGDSEVHALRQLELSMGAGEYVAVMGPSGSGKSTLVAALSGLLRPDAGQVTALDFDTRHVARTDSALDELADTVILRQRDCVALLIVVPMAVPATDDSDSKTNWMYFLTQVLFPLLVLLLVRG